MIVNIDRNELDSNYRYKMEALCTKIEGRGNGIKTILVNLNRIGADLKRNPEEILKYLGQKKGANTTAIQDKYILNGSFDSQDLQSEIYNYIEGYVKCFQCKLPETTYFKKSKKLFTKCSACSGECEIVDKLKSFILKTLDG